jgi:hypothetical protein
MSFPLRPWPVCIYISFFLSNLSRLTLNSGVCQNHCLILGDAADVGSVLIFHIPVIIDDEWRSRSC